MHFEVHTVDSFQVENNVAWTYVTDTGPAMRPTPTGELSSRRKKLATGRQILVALDLPSTLKDM